MKKTTFLLMTLLLALLVVSPLMAQEPVEFTRFFGECEDEYGDITDLEDVSNFTGECSIIQIMTNAYNEQFPDNPVDTVVTGWPGFTELNTRLAAGDAPDIAVLHGIRIPNYASRGLLTPVGDVLEGYGINVDDFTDAAREYVSYNGEIFGIPLDLHGHLYYINLDLWEQADMVDDEGVPVIPTGWEEWEAAGEQFFDATGLPLFEQPGGGEGWSRDWMALVYQQGGSIEDEEGLPIINTPEGAAAVNLIIEMYNGTFASEDGSTNTGEAFSNGETGSHRNGTWTVNYFDAQAADSDIPLSNFYVTSFPQFFDQPATWSSTHAYIIPLGVNADSDRVDRTLQFLAFMNEQNGVWSYTGHFPVNQSFIDSDAFTSIPHRNEYANFSDEAIPMPRHGWVTAYEDIMNEEIQAAVLGDKTVEQALADAQARFDDFVAFGQ
jgi:multiple sugar transport system substrate-binding protein